MTHFQPFKPTGMAHGNIQFLTKSWTGGPDEYEVEFDTSEKTARCSCMDSTCRRKNYFPIGSKSLCKHARLASTLLWPIIAKALGFPTREEAEAPLSGGLSVKGER
jgi:hypothetical protein